MDSFLCYPPTYTHIYDGINIDYKKSHFDRFLSLFAQISMFNRKTVQTSIFPKCTGLRIITYHYEYIFEDLSNGISLTYNSLSIIWYIFLLHVFIKMGHRNVSKI